MVRLVSIKLLTGYELDAIGSRCLSSLRHPCCQCTLDLSSEHIIRALFLEPVTSCCLLRSDYILCSVTWATDERVTVQWLNRTQNYNAVQTYELDGSSWKETQVGIHRLLSP